jgi:tetratricopeptide (TPR) repeat protein
MRPAGQRARKGVRTAISTALAVLLFGGQALAQDQAAIEKLVQMNKQALADYDTLEWESAKRTLLDAVTAGKKAGLDNHAVMARTYVHLGAVYVTGFKDRDKAIQSFTSALEIDPSIQLSRGIATQEVNEVFAEARRQRAGGGTVTPPLPPPPQKKNTRKLSVSEDSAEKDLPVKITALDCPNEDEAIIDRTATFRCALEQTPVLQQVANVFLIYQEPGKDNYAEVQMTKSPKGWYVGKIPKRAVVGK